MTRMEWPRATAAFFLPRRAVSRRYCAARLVPRPRPSDWADSIKAARNQTLPLRVLQLLRLSPRSTPQVRCGGRVVCAVGASGIGSIRPAR